MPNITINKYINYFIVAYALIIPLSRAGIAFFTILLLVLWCFDNIKEKIKYLPSSKVIISFALFFSINIVALFWTDGDNLNSAIKYISKYWYFLSILVIFTSLRKEFIYKTIGAFLLGMFISELISYGIFFELIEWKRGTPQNPVPFMSHLDYSVFLAFSSLLLLDRTLFEKEVKYKAIYFIFFISVTVNMFITTGRSGQVAFFITLIILFIYRTQNKLKGLIISIVSIALFATLAYNYSNTFHNRIDLAQDDIHKFVNESNYCSSWGNRVGALIITKDILIENPILGVGLVDNMDLLKEKIDNYYPSMKCFRWYMHYHNQYAQILTQTGVVGSIIFLSIFYSLLNLKFIEREFNIIKIILVSVFLISFIGDPYFHKQFTIVLFTLFTGILLAQHRIENEMQNKE